ncbi:thiosulfate reductase PhsA [Campylobacter sp. RM12327]|uniref:thiosulfate reductase PhsA n=1 Tax=Campylobacter sputorum TaxID=206 RepID=UPI000B78D361|nr:MULTISPECIES: thiosulfate reductase PhsA [Campylobacter]ASM39703.1 putative thiosulfate/polysulfide reductase, molybdenum-binding subunit [Campylobacter sputorum]MBE7358097.1 thiosulfate reductase PhsA [Campylobacter sp. RM11302]MBF6668909.1 thiosulfate reductase PhsA [Campylobacter sp. RM12327]MBF6673823.1 thiosulfate reductase PhsA [Campylobacter sp. RM13538]MBF6676273.1 thiosulfate reductase PhsA [Campylobacter sp. RM12321]
MDRRSFLKGTAGIGTLAAFELNLGASAKDIVEGTGVSKSVKSICEMCSSRCPVEVRVEEGKCTFITGNPKFSSNKTAVCARGGAGVNQLYDKERLVKPLIRVGKRGEGKWKEVSYEQALKFAADKLNEIKEKYGPQSVVFTSKSGESHEQMTNFACSYGSPNIFSHWSCCPITEKIAIPHTFGTSPKRDFKNAKYIVNFGHNLFEGINISDTKKLMAFADKKDTKLLVLEPRFSVIASKADEWLPVKPGTDLAFVMALIHVWIRDEKYDKKFIENYTIGFDELAKSVANSTPKWQEGITGISAESVERIANEIYSKAPQVIIDWGHKTTTTRAEYQRTRAIAIANALMGNFEKKGGLFFGKNAKKFNELCGEDLFPVLSNPNSEFKVPKTPRIDGCGEDGSRHFFIPRKHGILMDIAPAILNKKPYPIKGWVNTRFNHLINVAGTQDVIKAINELDFVMSIDIYMSDFSQYADVVFPEATYLERDESIQDKSGTAPGYYMRQKAIEPINGTLSGYEIFRKLAKIMNIDSLYKYNDINEFRMIQAKGDAKLLESLIKDGYVSWKVPQVYYREASYISKFVEKYPNAAKFVDENGEMSSQMKFKTPSGKIELFSLQVEEKLPGEGCLNTNNMDVFDGHELCLMSGKTPIHTNGHTQNIKILNDMMNDAPIWINTKTANKKDLKTGDKIMLKNKFGEEKGTVFVTEGIREDTLFVYHGFGHISKELKRTYGDGTNQSKILNPADGAVCGTMVTNVGVDIVKL